MYCVGIKELTEAPSGESLIEVSRLSNYTRGHVILNVYNPVMTSTILDAVETIRIKLDIEPATFRYYNRWIQMVDSALRPKIGE